MDRNYKPQQSLKQGKGELHKEKLKLTLEAITTDYFKASTVSVHNTFHPC